MKSKTHPKRLNYVECKKVVQNWQEKRVGSEKRLEKSKVCESNRKMKKNKHVEILSEKVE